MLGLSQNRTKGHSNMGPYHSIFWKCYLWPPVAGQFYLLTESEFWLPLSPFLNNSTFLWAFKHSVELWLKFYISILTPLKFIFIWGLAFTLWIQIYCFPIVFVYELKTSMQIQNSNYLFLFWKHSHSPFNNHTWNSLS